MKSVKNFYLFLRARDILRLPSFPLVPKGDKSLLLINSGMAPMKKIFYRRRNTAAHACMHLPKMYPHAGFGACGKGPHGMGHILRCWGNFSFGDYFKKEANYLGMGISDGSNGNSERPSLAQHLSRG